jgi:glycosyltransferase involved in cell wall biosynthesis
LTLNAEDFNHRTVEDGKRVDCEGRASVDEDYTLPVPLQDALDTLWGDEAEPLPSFDMNHLIISREYPPASYPAGGIGTYVANIACLMAERGETVHVIGERWEGATSACETSHEGRLVVHRIGVDDHLNPYWRNVKYSGVDELSGFRKTAFPNQWFAWHAAFLAEWLIDQENIDVIEGQEWEAPLYYLLQRRALGIGSERCPPVVVHLHSPTEFIFHFNGSLSTPAAYMPAKRMEEFCIRAADALLCPSRYFARQSASFYGIPPERIKVIHLPAGLIDLMNRDTDVWSTGGICFVGRLERRKGIIEWIEAATRVAQEDAGVEFDIVGNDVAGLQPMLVRSIPRRFRYRFRFHGPKTRAGLSDILAGARAAVVPSRWENFPNVCVEAMSSGLPVIATRFGGMVELLEDGRTGWLTPDTGLSGMVDGLADALRRCLAVSPTERASMGHAAADAVRRICANERIADEQIAFRVELARRGGRSLSRPSYHQNRPGPDKVSVQGKAQRGSGVVLYVQDPSDAEPTLASIRSQSVRPRVVVIVHQLSIRPGQTRPDEDVVLLCRPDLTGVDAWNAGREALRGKVSCDFWIFLEKYDSLLPSYIAEVERVFVHRPEIGVIAVWTKHPGRPLLEVPICPEPKYQRRGNDVTSASAFRADALQDIPPFRRGMRPENAITDLANAVMAKGWQAVAYPQILAQRRLERKYPGLFLGSLRVELLTRFADVIARDRRSLSDSQGLLPTTASDQFAPDDKSLFELLILCAGIFVRHPRRVARAVIRKCGRIITLMGSDLDFYRG